MPVSHASRPAGLRVRTQAWNQAAGSLRALSIRTRPGRELTVQHTGLEEKKPYQGIEMQDRIRRRQSTARGGIAAARAQLPPGPGADSPLGGVT